MSDYIKREDANTPRKGHDNERVYKDSKHL